MTKPSRPTALVALLLACALLAAGFVSHAHDDGHAGGDDHHCVICCLRHHSPVTLDDGARAPRAGPGGPPAAPSCRQSRYASTPATHPTRGPPA